MACQLPSELGTGAEIKWTIPQEVSERSDIDFVKIWRSGNENANYEELAEIPYDATTRSYFDSTGTRSHFYLVTFGARAAAWESCWHITFFTPLPYEAKLIDQIRRSTPKIIADTMTDEDFLNGLNLAVQIFNTYPPETYFVLADFPRSHIAYIIGLGQLTTLVSRFLPVSIRDWRYSEPGGVAMDIDRGAKMQAAMEQISKVYTQFIPLIKMDFAWDSPMGVGTVQLPVSMGGVVSRGLLNVLDIFTATGR